MKGPHFIGLHELFDQIDEAVESYVDLIAERIVQVGDIAESTVRVAAGRSRLEEYPLVIANGRAHVEAVTKALSPEAGSGTGIFLCRMFLCTSSFRVQFESQQLCYLSTLLDQFAAVRANIFRSKTRLL